MAIGIFLKRSKVSYKVLIQEISDGGLKLPDIQTRIHSIHLYWIKQMWNQPTSDSLLSLVAQEIFCSSDIHYLLLSKTNLADTMEERRLFLKQIFSTWARFHIKPPNTEEEVKKETLWENDFILIEKRPFTWPSWKKAGIVYINDLLHDSQPRFLSHTEIQTKYRVQASFLQLLQIRMAIPCSWKRKITEPSMQDLTSTSTIAFADGSTVQLLKESSKSLYSILIKYLRTTVTTQA